MTIDPRELMICNYVQTDSGTLVEVKGVSDIIAGIVNENETIHFAAAHLYPIPITEQWLKNFGFEDYDTTYLNGVDYIKMYDLGYMVAGETNKGWNIVNIQHDSFGNQYPELIGKCFDYVHQLQNVAFSVFGHELKLK